MIEYTVDDTRKSGRIISIYNDKMHIGDVRFDKKRREWLCSLCKSTSTSLARGCEHMKAAGAFLREREKKQREIWAKIAESDAKEDEPNPPRRRFAPCPD